MTNKNTDDELFELLNETEPYGYDGNVSANGLRGFYDKAYEIGRNEGYIECELYYRNYVLPRLLPNLTERLISNEKL